MTLEASTIIKRNPATLEVVAEVACTSPSEMASIVRKAREAQARWAAMHLSDRKAVLEKLLGLLYPRADELAALVCAETGKPRIEALSAEVMAGAAALCFSIDKMDELFRPTKVHLGRVHGAMRMLGRSSYLVPRPIGVVAVITPWNYPFVIAFSQVCMAVAAGNAAIIKPSSETPLCALRVVELFREAGAPEGLVQAVVGPGRSVGAALLASQIDKVLFTGSDRSGREIMAQCAQRLTPVVLELGGKDPLLVLPDADLERAAAAATWGAFVNAGQTCAGVKRLVIHEAVYDRFLASFRQKVEALSIGYGKDDPRVCVGPLISEQAVLEIEAIIADAVRQGAKVVSGGTRVEGSKGQYFRPTILVEVKETMDICAREVFGPVVTVFKAKDEEEMVRLVNWIRFALSASVWTADIAKGRSIAARLNGGTAVINNVPYTYGLAATPWGGSKDSGFGRTHGMIGFEELVERQHIHVDQGSGREIWWHPYDEEKLQANKDLFRTWFSNEPGNKLSTLLRIRRLMKK
jgi:acyl-CoA reductase-like NAD-dependent aldehyde dehydrogenase